MDELVKSPYEISIWEDVNITGTYNDNTKELIDPNNVVYGDGYKTFNYMKERKVAVIGSNSMSSPARAMEPCITRNVNGTIKLTFYIFNSYYDEDQDEVVLNPFKNLLINETKLKMKYQDEWYDLIIKDVSQDLESKKTTITASNLFINELSKNGYALILDVEKENNIGTVTDLAESILKDSDWEVDGTSDELVQTTEEALFQITLSIPLKACTVGSYYTDEQTIVTLPKGTIVYGFYSSIRDLKNGESSTLQILYHEDGIYKVDDDYVVVESSASALSNQYFIDNITYNSENKSYYQDSEICFSDVSTTYSELYRGDRLVKSSTMVYEPITGQVCYRYTFDVDENYWAELDDVGGDISASCLEFNESDFLNIYQTSLKDYMPYKISIDGTNDSNYIPDFDCFDYFFKDSDEDIDFITPEAGEYTFIGSLQEDNTVIWTCEQLSDEAITLTDYGIFLNETYLDKNNNTTFIITVIKNNNNNYLSFEISLSAALLKNSGCWRYWTIYNYNAQEYIPIDVSKIGISLQSYSFGRTSTGEYDYSTTYEGQFIIKVDRKDKKNYSGYMTTENKSVCSSALTNHIGDGDSFTSADNWAAQTEDISSPSYTIYPAYSSPDETKMFRDFLYFPGGSKTVGGKEYPYTYYTKIESMFSNYSDSELIDGRKYILRIAGGEATMVTPSSSNTVYKVLNKYPTSWTVDYGNETNNLPFGKITLCDYRIDDKQIIKYGIPYVTFELCDLGFEPRDYISTSDSYAKEGKRYYTINDSGEYELITGLSGGDSLPENIYEAETYNDYVTYTGTCSSSLTRREINSGLRERDSYYWYIGLFFECPSSSNNAAIESFQLFDYSVSDGEVCKLGSVPEVSTDITYTYFYLSDGAVDETDKVTVKTIINTKWEDTDDGVAHNVKPTLGDRPFEKIRTVSAKESNRFNLIQSLCETFECWALFNVEHDDNGALTLHWDSSTDNPSYAPIKKIKFKEVIGDNLGYGFKYGLNLKSMSRTMNSDSLVTKLIVNSNSNEYAPNGFCTIQRSQYNETKESYLLNFNYYIQHGMLEYDQVYNDFYSDGGFFDRLYQAGLNISEAESSLDSYSVKLINLESDQTVYQTGINNAITQQDSALDLLKQGLIDQGISVDGMNDYAVLEAAKPYVTAGESSYNEFMSNNFITYEQQDLKYNTFYWKKKQAEENMAKVKVKIAEYNAILQNYRDVASAINKEIYRKYFRYIQEGTWQSEDYYDDDLYYLDAKDVLGSSCMPEVKYSISVVDLKDLDEYETLKFDLGDVSFVQDPEFFGYTWVNGTKTPYKEEVVISEIKEYPEAPENNVVTIQNFKTQFEDLFQRITAQTQSLQYASGGYNRATKTVNLDGTFDSSTLSKSLSSNGNISITNSADQSNTYGSDGLLSTNLLNSVYQLKISNGQISASQDSGFTWKNIISSSEKGYLPLSGGTLEGIVYFNDIRTTNSQGFKISSNGDITHLRSQADDCWNINNSEGTSTIKIYPETGKIDFSGGLDIRSALYLIADLNKDVLTSGALFLQNSNLQGVSGMYFANVCDKSGEGINFISNATQKNVVDTLYGRGGELYWVPERTLSVQKQYDNNKKTVVNSGHQSNINSTVDVKCSSSDITKFSDGAYLTLTPGKWLLFGQVIINTGTSSGGRTNCARIVAVESGSNVVKMEEKQMAATNELAKLTVSTYVYIQSNTKVILQKSTSIAETAASDTSNHRTTLNAVCIGPVNP